MADKDRQGEFCGTVEEQTLDQTDRQASRRASLPVAEGWNLPGYQLLECLGQGTFGQVWSGIQRSTSQKVAIKVLHFTSQGLEREVARLRQVSEHPSVVGLIDANLEHRPAFLVMSLLQGSLSGAASRASLEQKVRWLEQAALALQYVH